MFEHRQSCTAVLLTSPPSAAEFKVSMSIMPAFSFSVIRLTKSAARSSGDKRQSSKGSSVPLPLNHGTGNYISVHHERESGRVVAGGYCRYQMSCILQEATRSL